MNLESIYQTYTAKMTSLHLYQRAMQKLAKSELNEINQLEKHLADNPHLEDDCFSYDKMAFRDAVDGEHVFFGFRKSSLEDSKKALHIHKNKQYQWLLTEAYEEFEDVLESLYAYAGYIDHNFWVLRDFGSITLSQLDLQSYTWFLTQAEKKKDAPSSIISAFRKKFPKIKEVEVNNVFNINLDLAITLVGFFRHIIVHRGGVVTDKEEFKKRILKKSGLYNNGKPDAEHVAFIEQFFGSGDYSNYIILLERRLHNGASLPTYINLFDVLTGYLMAYVYEIVKQLRVARA